MKYFLLLILTTIAINAHAITVMNHSMDYGAIINESAPNARPIQALYIKDARNYPILELMTDYINDYIAVNTPNCYGFFGEWEIMNEICTNNPRQAGLHGSGTLLQRVIFDSEQNETILEIHVILNHSDLPLNMYSINLTRMYQDWLSEGPYSVASFAWQDWIARETTPLGSH